MLGIRGWRDVVLPLGVAMVGAVGSFILTPSSATREATVPEVQRMRWYIPGAYGAVAIGLSYYEVRRAEFDKFRRRATDGTSPLAGTPDAYWKTGHSNKMTTTNLWWIENVDGAHEVVFYDTWNCHKDVDLCRPDRVFERRRPQDTYLRLSDGRAFRIERFYADYGDSGERAYLPDVSWMIREFMLKIGDTGRGQSPAHRGPISAR